MKLIKKTCFVLFFVGMCGCASQKEAEPLEEVHHLKPYQDKVIALENLRTRIIAYCYNSEMFTVEECAQDMERRGFVRLKDVPKVTADKDFLTTGTYPTRRWRETDVVPRW